MATWGGNGDNGAGVDYASMQMGDMTRLLLVAAGALVALIVCAGVGGWVVSKALGS